jgi:MerR family transcriptional regulator, copper efflux regulator
VPTTSDVHAVDHAPVACSLTVGQYGARVREWRTLLDGAHREILPDGSMRVRLPIARASELAQLVVAEQRCCPFFTFRLTLAGDHVGLDAYGPGGVEPLIAGLFGEQASSW